MGKMNMQHTSTMQVQSTGKSWAFETKRNKTVTKIIPAIVYVVDGSVGTVNRRNRRVLIVVLISGEDGVGHGVVDVVKILLGIGEGEGSPRIKGIDLKIDIRDVPAR